MPLIHFLCTSNCTISLKCWVKTVIEKSPDLETIPSLHNYKSSFFCKETTGPNRTKKLGRNAKLDGSQHFVIIRSTRANHAFLLAEISNLISETMVMILFLGRNVPQFVFDLFIEIPTWILLEVTNRMKYELSTYKK